MGRIRNWVKKLERDSKSEEISILQNDGSIARFPSGAWAEAFVHEAARMRAIYKGEDPGPAHALTIAKRYAKRPGEFGAVFDADRQPRGVQPKTTE